MEVREEVRRMSRKVASLEDILSDYIIISERDNRQLREDIRAMGNRMEADTAKLKSEMSEFKNEMSEFKNEMRKDRKEQNKQWGELNNRLGTFAEDVAAPNMPRIALDVFGATQILDHGVRRRKINPTNTSQYFEFDAITVTDKSVFLLETKFTPRDEYIKDIPKLIKNFKLCFSEYDNLPLINVFASWAISENHVRMLTKIGVYALAMGESTMEVLNFEALQHAKK